LLLHLEMTVLLAGFSVFTQLTIPSPNADITHHGLHLRLMLLLSAELFMASIPVLPRLLINPIMVEVSLLEEDFLIMLPPQLLRPQLSAAISVRNHPPNPLMDLTTVPNEDIPMYLWPLNYSRFTSVEHYIIFLEHLLAAQSSQGLFLWSMECV